VADRYRRDRRRLPPPRPGPGITGARWGTAGAQAILWLRALRANGDLDAYWDWHLQREHERNHPARYTLAA
jgi:hypothetical protein